MKKIISLTVTLIIALYAAGAAANDCPAGRLFSHLGGKTCIADLPQRIVVLEYSFLDQLGVLGITPIGYSKDSMPAYLNEFAAASTPIGSRKTPSLEKITALKPDLIIADKRLHTQIYSQLAEIAPTLLRNGMRGSLDDQIATLRQLATVTNKAEIAEVAIAETEEKLAQTRQNSVSDKVVIGVFRPGSMSAHGKESFIGSLIEQMGKENVLDTQAGDRQYYLTLEGLAAVNPDSLVLMCGSDAQSALDDMLKNPLFKALTAVKNQRLYLVPRLLWAKGRGLLGINHILDTAAASGLLASEPTQRLTCLD